MSEVKSRVNVHSKLTVVSSKPTEPGKTHKLTALDHAMGHHTLHFTFYYRVNPFKDGPFESDLDNLRVTISDLLCTYPPVTGRLVRREEDGNWEVKCNDAGVRTLRASVGTTLDEWLRSVDAAEERDLTVWEDMPDDPSIWSPFRIQLNDFEGGGLAIGFCFTHIQADLSSALLFFKSWAGLNRGEPIEHPPVFHLPALHDRASSKTNAKSIKNFTKKVKTSKTSSTKMATATFKFSNSIIKQSLSNIVDKCPDATPFDFLAALFWTRILQVKPSTIHDQTHALSVGIDLRKHSNSQFPYGYFGNALHFSSLSLDANALEGCTFGLGDVVRVVHSGVACIEEDEFFSAIDWLESQKGESGTYALPFQMYGPELTCVSMEHMIGSGETGAFEPLSFKKDEKPVHVSCHVGNVEGEGLILVMPSPEGGLSRSVTVTLPEEEIDRLRADQIIADLEPVMIISGRI